jgi:diaminohydroxyphosphoribosylaminopyrimidine deaminase/5-amino-6-(5-phosphoribosylamino)uracil reductase
MPHAEVEAINAASQNSGAAMHHSVLYVTLEPCCHFGKTPPCTDLIIRSGIPRVVVATADPFPKVNGSGIERLRANSIEVTVGVMEREAQALNCRFFTYHTEHRPYVILKWAQTADGFIDRVRDGGSPAVISSAAAHRLSHLWRTQEQAIMVGTRTALLDNPQLTARLCAGKNPLRVVPDADNKLPRTLQLFDNQAVTLVLGTRDVSEMLATLYEKQIQSLIVEGGAQLLQSFIRADLWDEARIITAPHRFGAGVAAPKLT